jgi:acyl transferase domain-containing protein
VTERQRRDLLKDALLAVEQMRAKAGEAERERHAPIAIVGTACRFPGGAGDPDAFWELVRAGFDAVTEVPHERWDAERFYDPDPDAPGKATTRWGAFIDDVASFDAAFFRIAPREAASMDPQQRLLLESAWHALEDAGYPPDRLAGTRTGVYVGISTSDYAQYVAMRAQVGHPEAMDGYTGTGNAFSVAAGRIAHVLGLQGPAIAIDTACSSSLVAIDAAVQHLRSGRCDLALAGGVNAILSPVCAIYFSKLRAMSPEGRCKTFDASADGYVRGEGCGVVVLKRLRDAQRAGDRVLAVIRGSAVNHDGHSGGLTVPNGLAQEAVIRAALADANAEPDSIDYVEAHGTGTPLGDPIELRALGRVFGARTRPLVVGSVKTNVGHLEAAAGVAGVIKVVLALRHGEIPPHANFRTPSPHVAWDQLPVRIPTELTAWPERAGGAPRRAGVSSFGFGGTNAHLVLESAPQPAPLPGEPAPLDGEPAAPRPVELFTLSAKSAPALAALAARYAAAIGEREPAPGDLCFSANTTRAALSHRAALTVSSASEAAATLGALARGELAAGVEHGVADGSAPQLVFLFTGQGAQYAGMGRELYEREPVFHDALERCDAVLREHGVPLLRLLHGELGAQLDRTIFTQPALFALEYALAEQWRSWGVEPAAVAGHSVGEYVAACLAGVLALEDALALVAARGRLMQSLPPTGAMAAVRAEPERVEPLLAGPLAVAALNAPGETVVSGEREAIAALSARLSAQGIAVVPLRVSHAFHSPLMDPILEEFEAIAARCAFAPPQLRLLSNLSGTWAGDELTRPRYWRDHLRGTVRFAQSVRTAADEGHQLFLELGPQLTLCALGARTVPGAQWLPSLRRERSDLATMLHTAGALWVRGVPLDRSALHAGRRHDRLSLPLYPFQHERFWIDAAAPREFLDRALGEPGTAVTHADGEAPLAALLRDAPPAERVELLETAIRDEVARVVGSAERPEPKSKFFELGMDSLMAVQLKSRLETAIGKPLAPTIAFDHPDAASLARFVVEHELGLDATAAAPHAAPAASATAASNGASAAGAIAAGAIAVVGIGCRFPGGANDPDAFWELLRDGRDAVGPVPRERWDAEAFYDPRPDAPGKSYVREGAFLRDGVETFDARFFGIAPREAASMDPQQRLFLELCWEALEHACCAPERLDGSRTGVFIGINASDYTRRLMLGAGGDALDAYAFTGTTFSVAAGRVSHLLGLQGPSIAVDTACSSSLVAVHLAAQSLRTGECDVALAGGVNLILSPDGNVVLSRMHALAADGRCKAFDARADGYGRGEGGGVVVLKRLADAQREGDRVLAVLRASATNHDGPSGGLTVPNGTAQEALIRGALAQARIDPRRVGYLEAHGTGTALGDPIELEAVRRTLCAGRDRASALVVSSVKTNVGHLEAAAGIAGLIKAVLALERGAIPAHLHFERGNPNVDWETLPVRIPPRTEPWPAARPRIAAVSSFGMSGTNAHAILEEPPPPAPVANELERPLHLVALSARSERALAQVAARLHDALAGEPDAALADVAFSANAGRSHFEHRLALAAGTSRELREQLAEIAEERLPSGAARGRAESSRPRVALAFGARRARGIARALYETHPLVRRIADEAAALCPERPLLATLLESAQAPSQADEPLAVLVQQYAVAQLWRSWGVEAAVLVADGTGAYAAACAAGSLSFGDALALLAQRDPLDGSRAIAHAPARVRTLFARDAPDGAPFEPRDARAFGDLLATLADDGTTVIDAAGGAWPALLATLARLYARGYDVDWNGFDAPYARRRVALPTYPFERKRHWIDLPEAPAQGARDRGDPLYVLAWKPNEAPAGPPAPAPRTWLLLGRDGDPLSAAFARALRDAGDAVTLVVPGTAYEPPHRGRAAIDPHDPAAFERVVADTFAADEAGASVLDLWSAAPSAIADGAQAGDDAFDETFGCDAILRAVQAAVKVRAARPPRFWAVTCGAQPAGSDDVRALARSTVWGMGRAVALEHPELWGGLIDLDPDDPLAGVAQAAADVRRGEGEQQLAYRGGRRLAARLERAPRATANGGGATIRADGAYLVTGGLGSLGLEVAAWLVRNGARALVLAARHAPGERAREAIAALERDGAHVLALEVDVADRGALAAALDYAARELPPLRGVVHAAGVLDDGVVLMQTPERFAAVMAPKVRGTWNLHALTAREPLDFFVTFSSVAAVLGSPGQSNYAAANAYMDALARVRRARGLPALSVAWGPWSGAGMAASLAQRSSRQWIPAGVTALAAGEALALLGDLLAARAAQAVVLPVDWQRFVDQFPPGIELRALADLAPPRARADAAPGAPLRDALATLAPPERHPHAVAHLQREVARVMGLDPSEAPEPESGFFEIGLDSLMALELKTGLGIALGIDLPATVVFQYSSIDALARYLVDEALAFGDAPQAEAFAPLAAEDGAPSASEDELLAMLAVEIEAIHAERARAEAAR